MNVAMGDNTAVRQCRECLAGRPHCHGTLIHHHGQKTQCTDPECNHPEVLLHSLAVDCEAVGCPCGEHWDHQVELDTGCAS